MNRLFLVTIFLIGGFIWGCRTQQTEIASAPVHEDWSELPEGFKAGALWVPENHDDPEGTKIKISYFILKAKDSSSNEYPVVFFSGGPGGNTLDPDMLDFVRDLPQREKRDVIFFDQRGIGYSSAMPDMSFAAFEILAADADEQEELQLTREMLADYKKQCRDKNIHPEYYNSLQNARDVGMLFKKLGYKKYNLMGGSYGTRIARVVQDMYPEYIHAAVLDSPSPLSGDFLMDRLYSYSLALSRIFEYYENQEECSTTHPNLKQDYFRAIERLENKPLQINFNDSIEVTINAQDGIYLLRRLLYIGNAREKAPELIQAFLIGQGEVLQEVLQFEYALTGGLNLTMLLSVERFEQFNEENNTEKIEAAYANYPLIPVKLGFFDAFYQAGMSWHEARLPMEDRVFRDSDIPTLIFVNRYDPVTPPKNGHLFMENLSKGKLLILDEGGHGSGNQQCKDSVVSAFLSNPQATLDTGCLNLYQE
ncbi:alpha/beta fold hydrolase [Robiginitalea sp. IMCC43444]|uniref:alpha/beta fold hydrolase n=1 Tax=Robiginitalea sp. IMCC43444 TaxID=3459121 RepID=UPI004042BF73